MPIRIASFTKRISDNGQALHRARMSRQASGSGEQPSEEEVTLAEERRKLKEERDKRHAQALEPKHAIDRLVRTHHPQPKAKSAAPKAAQEAKKKPTARRSRAEKHAEQAAAIEAARKSHKKPAATK